MGDLYYDPDGSEINYNPIKLATILYEGNPAQLDYNSFTLGGLEDNYQGRYQSNGSNFLFSNESLDNLNKNVEYI